MYTEENKNRALEIINEIEKTIAKRDFFVATYKDRPLLIELEKIAENGLDEQEESLLFAYDLFVYLAEKYTSMGRFPLSGKFNEKALNAAMLLKQKYGKESERVNEIYSNLLRDRNYYVDDNCKEILEAVIKSHVIGEDEAIRIHRNRMNRRRNLKHDPVEMTEEYLNVIDEIDEKIEKNRKHYGMGACYEIWNLKQQFLLEKGIYWKSPFILNPGVIFD